MLTGEKRTAGVSAVFLLLLLLSCRRSEPDPGTGSPPPAQPAPPADVCGAQGTWRFSCPSVKTDEACNIRTIGAMEQRFTITQNIAESGGIWWHLRACYGVVGTYLVGPWGGFGERMGR